MRANLNNLVYLNDNHTIIIHRIYSISHIDLHKALDGMQGLDLKSISKQLLTTTWSQFIKTTMEMDFHAEHPQYHRG